MNVLVTGGSGHLGANLIRRLLERGESVRALARKGSNNAALEGLGVERVEGDLREPASLRAAVRGCRRIYHCAAKVSTADAQHQEIYECNVLGTRNLLRAALEAGVSRVVVTGSFSAVGHDPSRTADDETVPFHPFERHLPYGISKAFVEQECWKAALEGLEVVVAVSCAILGPHDFKPSRMGRVLVDFANGRLRAYIPGGFEFVSARDIVEGHVLAMEKGRQGQKYVFSTEFLSIDRLMGLLEEVTGQPRPRLRLPPPLMAGLATVSNFFLTRLAPERPQRFTPGAVRLLRMQRRADITKAKTELGYQPSSIAGAVREAYAWFADRGAIARPKRAVASYAIGTQNP